MESDPLCMNCSDSGVVESGNNDFPCHCPAGDKAKFNVSGRGQVTGSELKKEYEERRNWRSYDD